MSSSPSTAHSVSSAFALPPPCAPDAPPGPDAPCAVEVCATYRGVTTHARVLSFPPPHGRRPRDRRQFTIGSNRDVDAPVGAAFVPWASHPLVMAAGDDYVVTVTSDMTGWVHDAGQVLSLGEYVTRKGRCFPLPAVGRAEVACGAVTFTVARTSAPRLLPRGVHRWNWNEHICTAGSALALLALLLVMSFTPADPKSISLDLAGLDNRYLPFLIKPSERAAATPPWLAERTPTGRGAQSAAMKMKGAAGAMGDKSSPTSNARHGIAGPDDHPDPMVAKRRAIDTATRAGILGILRSVRGSHITSIFGDDRALGSDAENALGDLTSHDLGNAYGIGGLGVTGTGDAGGGAREGTLGTGGLHTIGGGDPGAGGDAPYGTTVGALRSRRASVPRWIPGDGTVRGALDKEIVRRVIRLHLNEIKFCYEGELVKRPALGGRIVVQFAIAATGQVISSALQSSTMGNAAVEACTVLAIRRWPFPRPAGGGLVIVSYPFVLVPAGGQ